VTLLRDRTQSKRQQSWRSNVKVGIIANKKNKYIWLTTGPTMERKIAREGIKIYG